MNAPFAPTKRRQKYGAKPVIIDGIRFDSQAEGAHYQDLKLLERAGQIRQLEIHPIFKLVVNGTDCGKAIMDFAYFEDNARVVIDIKGHDTALSRLKRKLVKAIYGIDVRVVKR